MSFNLYHLEIQSIISGALSSNMVMNLIFLMSLLNVFEAFINVKIHSTTNIRSLATSDSSDEFFDFTYDKGEVSRVTKSGFVKERKNEIQLPFVIVKLDDNGKEMELGTVKLPESTSIGDILNLSSEESSENENKLMFQQAIYEVFRVSFLYTYKNGGFQVYMKKLHVKSSDKIESDVLQ